MLIPLACARQERLFVLLLALAAGVEGMLLATGTAPEPTSSGCIRAITARDENGGVQLGLTFAGRHEIAVTVIHSDTSRFDYLGTL
eukprot:1668066-Pleurochrysis_carterae.AAC.1